MTGGLAAELDSHPPGAAPGVEDGGRRVRGDEGRLTVHVHARGGQVLETPVVVGPPRDVALVPTIGHVRGQTTVVAVATGRRIGMRAR